MTMSTAGHQTAASLAVLALIVVLYVPLYTSLREVKIALYIMQENPDFGQDPLTCAKGGGGTVPPPASPVAARQATAAAAPPSPERWVADMGRIMESCKGVKCLDLLKGTDLYMRVADPTAWELEYCERERVIFHFYWNGHMDPRTAMIVRSYLHTQDLRCTRMYVWTMSAESHACQLVPAGPACSADDGTLAKYPNVEFKLLDVEKEIAALDAFVGKDLDVPYLLKRAHAQVSWSDIFRFIVLANYGGIYIDADVLLLRDMQPLFPHEFAYRWSHLEKCNTAVLRLRKGGATVRSIIRDAVDNHYEFHPFKACAYAKNRSLPLYVLDPHLFDPMWLINDGHERRPPQFCFGNFSQAFSLPCTDRGMFGGAFAYHWHNNYNTPVAEGSWMWSWMTYLQKVVT